MANSHCLNLYTYPCMTDNFPSNFGFDTSRTSEYRTLCYHLLPAMALGVRQALQHPDLNQELLRV